jgi:hypothetical protein
VIELAASPVGVLIIEGASRGSTTGGHGAGLALWAGAPGGEMQRGAYLPMLWGDGLPAVRGNRLFLAQPNAERIAVIDAGAMPMRLERFLPAPKVRQMVLVGDLLLLRAEDGLLTVIDATKDGDLAELAALPLGERSTALAAAGAHAWMGVSAVGGEPEAIVGVDFSRPEVPRVVARIENVDRVQRLAASEDRLMAATVKFISSFRQDGLLRLYDLSNPAKPSLLNSPEYDVFEGLLNLAFGAARSGGEARLVTLFKKTERLRIFDARDGVRLATDYELPVSPTGAMALRGSQAWVASSAGLLAFDLGAEVPTLLQTIDLPAAAREIALGDEQGFVATGSRGVYAFRAPQR